MRHEELNTLAREISEHLSVIRQILRRPMEAEFARGHLTGPQQLVMEVLVRSHGLSLKELSQQVSLSHSTVSGIVDRLRKTRIREAQGGSKRSALHGDHPIQSGGRIPEKETAGADDPSTGRSSGASQCIRTRRDCARGAGAAQSRGRINERKLELRFQKIGDSQVSSRADCGVDPHVHHPK